jgi:Domain of unknown function (DUF4845)
MESNRKRYRVAPAVRAGQRGMTVLGFLFLAALFGVVALAGIKVTPMYIKSMRMSQVLRDIQQELNGKGTSAQAIRVAIAKRFSIEDINLPIEEIKIVQSANGYSVRIQYENRVPYFADLWLLTVFDKQVEIRR